MNSAPIINCSLNPKLYNKQTNKKGVSLFEAKMLEN